ncbi:MAG TPA: hypothetical protein EYG68_05065 [Leucothrix mucor]|nr:hypothetical protein [Leucothrix mucor]
MKWKALLWTVVLAAVVFFVLVFLGMKYQWVQALQDKRTIPNEKVELAIPEHSVEPELVEEQARPSENGNAFSPSLLGEETDVVDFTGMPLELVVAECRRISTKIGVPANRFTQSVNECAAQNFQGKAAEDMSRSRNVNAGLRKQCKGRIPYEQQALFSPEEMKLLIDECMANLDK